MRTFSQCLAVGKPASSNVSSHDDTKGMTDLLSCSEILGPENGHGRYVKKITRLSILPFAVTRSSDNKINIVISGQETFRIRIRENALPGPARAPDPSTPTMVPAIENSHYWPLQAWKVEPNISPVVLFWNDIVLYDGMNCISTKNLRASCIRWYAWLVATLKNTAGANNSFGWKYSLGYRSLPIFSLPVLEKDTHKWWDGWSEIFLWGLLCAVQMDLCGDCCLPMVWLWFLQNRKTV